MSQNPDEFTYSNQDAVNLITPDLFSTDAYRSVFAHLRKNDPVHFQNHPAKGPFWSVTRFKDIMEVETNHRVYSSQGSVLLEDKKLTAPMPMLMAMDPPTHSELRTAIAPAFGPDRMSQYQSLIRQRTIEVLDTLPIDEPFDWVEKVSTDLTIKMLCTLFDFPVEERELLTQWSNAAATSQALTGESNLDEDEALKQSQMMECFSYFEQLQAKKKSTESSDDLYSILTHQAKSGKLTPSQKMGNLLMLILAGNDTTRNTMTGSVIFLNDAQEQFSNLKANPELITGLANESLRHQSAIAYMRRTARVDTELHGKRIQAGDRIVMWYVSGNMDETVFENPYAFDISRKNANKHLAFGVGIHRCLGAKLAAIQIRVLWEEILKRFSSLEINAPAVVMPSLQVKGYTSLSVTARK